MLTRAPSLFPAELRLRRGAEEAELSSLRGSSVRFLAKLRALPHLGSSISLYLRSCEQPFLLYLSSSLKLFLSFTLAVLPSLFLSLEPRNDASRPSYLEPHFKSSQHRNRNGSEQDIRESSNSLAFSPPNLHQTPRTSALPPPLFANCRCALSPSSFRLSSYRSRGTYRVNGTRTNSRMSEFKDKTGGKGEEEERAEGLRLIVPPSFPTFLLPLHRSLAVSSLNPVRISKPAIRFRPSLSYERVELTSKPSPSTFPTSLPLPLQDIKTLAFTRLDPILTFGGVSSHMHAIVGGCEYLYRAPRTGGKEGSASAREPDRSRLTLFFLSSSFPFIVPSELRSLDELGFRCQE